MSALAYLALGSNLGDRRGHLDRAVAALRATPGLQVLRLSSLYETEPVGGPVRVLPGRWTTITRWL